MIVLALAAAAAVVAVIVTNGEDSGNGSPQSGRPGATAGQLRVFSGKGNATTAQFSAQANWEIKWSAAPHGGFTVELIRADHSSGGQVVKAGTKPSGATFVSEHGSFRLRVTAIGRWSIHVIGRPG